MTLLANQGGPETWCRARDLNPHGKPIRPSSVRVYQFRQPGTFLQHHNSSCVCTIIAGMSDTSTSGRRESPSQR